MTPKDILFKPLIDMGIYLDSRIEEDKLQLVEDGITRLKWLFVIIACLGVTIGVEVVFLALRLRGLI